MKRWVAAGLLLLAFLATAKGFSAAELEQTLRQEYGGLLEALARDGIQLDFRQAEITTLSQEKDWKTVHLPEKEAGKTRSWSAGLNLDIRKGRLKNIELILQASKGKSFSYGITRVSWRLEKFGPDSIIAVATRQLPGAREAYAKAGERILAARLPATYEYLKAAKASGRWRIYLALAITLFTGLLMAFFAATQPHVYCHWMACRGHNARSVATMAALVLIILVINNPLRVPNFFDHNMFLIWMMVAAGLTATLATSQAPKNLDYVSRGIFMLAALGLAVVLVLRTLEGKQLHDFSFYAFIMGYFVGMMPLAIAAQKGWLR